MDAVLGQPLGADEAAEIERLKAAFTDEAALEGHEREEAAGRLLLHAMLQRDTAGGALIAQVLDVDLALDTALEPIIQETLETQPDAVYAFIRAYLADHFNPRWLPRLKLAALSALRVAVTDAPAETIADWLTLIAREPQSYDLGDTLHYGLLAAQARAADDPELARQLISLAARRDPGSLDTLLADQALLNALPNNLGRVLREFDGDALGLLQYKGVELFLAGLARAAQVGNGLMFVPQVIAQLWELYVTQAPFHPMLPPPYYPENLIQDLIHGGATFLPSDSLEGFAALMLSSQRDDLFRLFLGQESGKARLVPRLLAIFDSSGRPFKDISALLTQTVSDNSLTPQQAADLYIVMLERVEEQDQIALIIQPLARILQQFPFVEISPETLWNLLTLAANSQDDLVAKVVAKRLLLDIKALEDEGELVESLRRLCGAVQWSEGVRQGVTIWWREFVRGQPAMQLGRLERALEGKRGLDEERGILQTLNALRKLLGQRSLSEFANDVRAAYTVLEAVADSFDAPSRRTGSFDMLVAHTELDDRGEQISPEERQVLANNLKELAQIIAAMGDNRTRATLMRRGDDLDRDLMSGEQAPHSGVDALKWLAGYWGGTRNGEKDKN